MFNSKKEDEDIEGDSDKSDEKGEDDSSDESNEASKKAPAIRGIGVSRNRRKIVVQAAALNESIQAQNRKDASTIPKKPKKKTVNPNKVQGNA